MPVKQGGVAEWPGTHSMNFLQPPDYQADPVGHRVHGGHGRGWEAFPSEGLLGHPVDGPERRIRNLAHVLHNALPQGQGRDIRFIRMLGYGGQGVAGLFVYRRHGVRKYFVAKVTLDSDRVAGNRELMEERRITRVSSSAYLVGCPCPQFCLPT